MIIQLLKKLIAKPKLAAKEEALAYLDEFLIEYPSVVGANRFVIELDPRFSLAMSQLADEGRVEVKRDVGYYTYKSVEIYVARLKI